MSFKFKIHSLLKYKENKLGLNKEIFLQISFEKDSFLSGIVTKKCLSRCFPEQTFVSFRLLHQADAGGGSQGGGDGGEDGRQQVDDFLDDFFFGHGWFGF